VLTRGNDNDYSGADQQQREAAEKNKYGTKLIQLPVSKLVTFNNGRTEKPDAPPPKQLNLSVY
jgi:hypothetical protein